MDNFTRAIEFTLQWEGEGGKADPGDPGGLTKWGISQRAHPNVDVASLTREQAVQIYHDEYWVFMGCDGFDFPLDAVVFDTAVNLGPARVKAWLLDTRLWQEILLRRIKHYVGLAQERSYFRGILYGLLRRCMSLYDLCNQ